MGPSEQDVARAASLGFELMDDEEMTFSSERWEPTRGPGQTYAGMQAEPARPAWLPRDIITAVQPDEQEAVRHVQRTLRVAETGIIDPATRSAILGVQQLFALPTSGVLDAETGRQVDRLGRQYGS